MLIKIGIYKLRSFMATVCVIPARFESRRFPGKLLAKVQGKTVLQYTFEAALACRDLDTLYVATDDERIAEHVRLLKGEVIWTSPTCQDGTERIKEALQLHSGLQKSSILINLQGDHPCTEPETISAVVRLLKEDPKASVATAVSPLKSREEYLSPHCVKCVFDQKGYALYFSRSPIPYCPETLPLTAFGHIGIYGYRTAFFTQEQRATPLQLMESLEQLRLLERGYPIKVALVKEKILGIDTPQDLAKLENFLCPQSTSS